MLQKNVGLSQSRCSTKLDPRPAFLPVSDKTVRGPRVPEGILRLSDQPTDTGRGRGGEGRGRTLLPPRGQLPGLSATKSTKAKAGASGGPALPWGFRQVSSPLQPQPPSPTSRETWAPEPLTCQGGDVLSAQQRGAARAPASHMRVQEKGTRLRTRVISLDDENRRLTRGTGGLGQGVPCMTWELLSAPSGFRSSPPGHPQINIESK